MATFMQAAGKSKSQKKTIRKQEKKRQSLLKRNGIVPANYVTHHLVVANGGLDNNVTSEELYRIFRPHGEVLDIVMLPQKSYAFVSMASLAGAEAAFLGVNGRLLASPQEVASPCLTLYLDYVDTVPGVAVPSKMLPPGLILVENFVSEIEEETLLQAIDWEQKDKQLSESAGSLKHRRVKHYGYEFLYGTNNVDHRRPLEHGIPAGCRPVVERLVSAGLLREPPDQLTVNQYEPGQGIPPHVDTHSAFEDHIVSLSLESQCVMDFRHPEGKHMSVLLPRRSALVMTGEARYLWTHGITPRKSDIVVAESVASTGRSSLDEPRKREYLVRSRTTDDHPINGPDVCESRVWTPSATSACDEGPAQGEARAGETSRRLEGLTLVKRQRRTSFTFRKLRNGPCRCAFATICDSQQQKKQEDQKNRVILQMPQSESEAAKVESQHVHQVYDEIADHFSGTRHSPWPRVAQFLRCQPEGATVVDVGCGNGKYLGANPTCFNVGCDRSPNLCMICQERGFPVFVADILHLPLRSNVADVAISIAVIHHLSTQTRRQRAIQEIVRILRPGGQALIYVWALEQEKDNIKSNYLKASRIEMKDVLKSSEEKYLCVQNDILSTSESGCHDAENMTPAAHLLPNESTKGCSNIIQNVTKCAAADPEITSFSDDDNVITALSSLRPCSSGGATVTGGPPDGHTVSPDQGPRCATAEVVAGATPAAPVGGGHRGGGSSGQEAVSSLVVHVNRTHFENQDLLVPWHSKATPKKSIETSLVAADKDKVLHRFYHVFQEGELEKLCDTVPAVRVKESYYDKGNWCVVIEKEAGD